MLRRTALALAGSVVALALTACAPALPGMPGTVIVPDGPIVAPPPVEPAQQEPSRAVDGSFSFGTGPVVIDTWVDFFCPYCRMFDESNGEYLRAMVDQDSATLRVHPIAILDRASMGTRYSTRAAAAFACVAEHASPAEALDYMDHLYEHQPPESTPGLTDAELAAGAPAAAAACIEDGRFTDWVGESTSTALDRGVQGTPTVLVNGSRFTGALRGADFRNFIAGVTAII